MDWRWAFLPPPFLGNKHTDGRDGSRGGREHHITHKLNVFDGMFENVKYNSHDETQCAVERDKIGSKLSDFARSFFRNTILKAAWGSLRI